MAGLKQIHSAKCLRAGEPGMAGEGDALITNQPDLAVSIRTADCLPILVADVRHGAIAAIHAGWRGTAARIVGETLTRMHAEFDTDPRDVYAAIGPGIGGCCFEVGDDVALVFGRSGAGRIDLAELNRTQLLELGIPEGQIELLALCTFCDADRFHSYRRDKERAGRMISYIRVIQSGGM